MGKRKRKDADSDDELLRKIRRLERRVARRRRDDDHAPHDSDSHYQWRSEETTIPDPEPFYYSDSDEYSVRSVVTIADEPPNVPTENVEQTTPTVPPNAPEPPLDHVVAGTSADPPALPAAILEILGESKEKEETFGPKIREEISKRWGKIIMEGLNKEQKQKLMEGVLVPENFQLLKAPKLNPEIAAVLSESTRNRDKRLEKSQNHLGIAIAAITNLMTALIDGEIGKEQIIKQVSEAGQILLDLHSQNTTTRRQLITYSLDKKFLTMHRDVKRDAFLFSENLGEKIKASKTAEKSGLHIKRKFESSTSYRPNRPTTTHQGNSLKGPPRQYARRGKPGGPRNQASAQVARRHPAPPPDRYNSASKSSNKPSSMRKTP